MGKSLIFDCTLLGSFFLLHADSSFDSARAHDLRHGLVFSLALRATLRVVVVSSISAIATVVVVVVSIIVLVVVVVVVVVVAAVAVSISVGSRTRWRGNRRIGVLVEPLADRLERIFMKKGKKKKKILDYTLTRVSC